MTDLQIVIQKKKKSKKKTKNIGIIKSIFLGKIGLDTLEDNINGKSTTK